MTLEKNMTALNNEFDDYIRAYDDAVADGDQQMQTCLRNAIAVAGRNLRQMHLSRVRRGIQISSIIFRLLRTGLWIIMIQILLIFSFLYTFAFVAEKCCGKEIIAGAKRTSVNHYDYIHFALKALGTIGFGAASEWWIGVVMVSCSVIQPISVLIVDEFFCFQ
jgi:hypothetical protein